VREPGTVDGPVVLGPPDGESFGALPNPPWLTGAAAEPLSV
jgi:hypothetical protein